MIILASILAILAVLSYIALFANTAWPTEDVLPEEGGSMFWFWLPCVVALFGGPIGWAVVAIHYAIGAVCLVLGKITHSLFTS